jgi:hypothetical protein
MKNKPSPASSRCSMPLSGDQNGSIPPSVPDGGRASVAATSLIDKAPGLRIGSSGCGRHCWPGDRGHSHCLAHGDSPVRTHRSAPSLACLPAAPAFVRITLPGVRSRSSLLREGLRPAS